MSKKTLQPPKEGRIFSRNGIYHIAYYYPANQEHRESSKSADYNEAVRLLKRRLDEIAAKKVVPEYDLITPQLRRQTVADLVDGLTAHYIRQKKGSAQNLSNLRRVKQDFGEYRAVEMTRADVDRYIVKRQQLQNESGRGHADASINRVLQMLSQAFGLAEIAGPKIELLSEIGNERQGFFTEEEIQNVIENIDGQCLKDFVRFGSLTGWRMNEIRSLSWANVSNGAIVLLAKDAKGRRARVVPLEGELGIIFQRRFAARSFEVNGVTAIASYVFHEGGQQIGDIRKNWQTACVLAGLGDFYCRDCDRAIGLNRLCEPCGRNWRTKEQPPLYRGRVFHDLRRSACRNMIDAGVPQSVAMDVSGHRTDNMFRRYAIVAAGDVRKALRMTQEYLKTIDGGQEGPFGGQFGGQRQLSGKTAKAGK
jgi:integrase